MAVSRIPILEPGDKLPERMMPDRLSEASLKTTIGAEGAERFDRLSRIDVREYGTLAAGTGAADANTATIKAALASDEGDIFIPPGAWHALPGAPTSRSSLAVRLWRRLSRRK